MLSRSGFALAQRSLSGSTRIVLLLTALGSIVPPGIHPAALLAAQEPAEEPELGVVVQGVVVDHETGDSLSEASVSLGAGTSDPAGRGTRITGEGGRFRFEDVPPGTYRILVRLQGYRDMNDSVQVPADEDIDVVLPLTTGAVGVRPIIVPKTLPPAVPRYEQRRRGGARFLITRNQIEGRRPRFISELLHRVPGGMVVPITPYGYTLLLRGLCRPGIWVDGVEMIGAKGIDQVVTPHDVEALEVFHGTELPTEYGVDACGGILVWTRHAPSPSQEAESGGGRGVLEPFLGAVAVIVLLVVLTR